MALEPFNGIATAIFLLAIVHTFAASRVTAAAHRLQDGHDAANRRQGRSPSPSVMAELLHLLGEVEVVFGLWALVLLGAMTLYAGWDTARDYVNNGVTYTEPLFVVVVMTLAATRPIVSLAESCLRRLADIGKGTPGAWSITILMIGPLLGSFITEPGAMTICALLLARQFFDLQPAARLKYRDAGAALRERLDRRHADALRGAAGPDGGPSVGLGYGLHARAFRLARGRGDRGVDHGVLPVLSR